MPRRGPGEGILEGLIKLTDNNVYLTENDL